MNGEARDGMVQPIKGSPEELEAMGLGGGQEGALPKKRGDSKPEKQTPKESDEDKEERLRKEEEEMIKKAIEASMRDAGGAPAPPLPPKREDQLPRVDRAAERRRERELEREQRRED